MVDIAAVKNKKQILEKQIEEGTSFIKFSNRIDEALGLVDNSVYKSNLKQEQQAAQAQQQLPEVEKLLRELLAATKSGGNMYMDSTKVNTAQGLTAYRG